MAGTNSAPIPVAMKFSFQAVPMESTPPRNVSPSWNFDYRLDVKHYVKLSASDWSLNSHILAGYEGGHKGGNFDWEFKMIIIK